MKKNSNKKPINKKIRITGKKNGLCFFSKNSGFIFQENFFDGFLTTKECETL